MFCNIYMCAILPLCLATLYGRCDSLCSQFQDIRIHHGGSIPFLNYYNTTVPACMSFSTIIANYQQSTRALGESLCLCLGMKFLLWTVNISGIIVFL